jgi:hypothetical protein
LDESQYHGKLILFVLLLIRAHLPSRSLSS